MRDTNRSIIRTYVVGSIWLIVMLATVATLFAPLDAIFSSSSFSSSSR